MKCTPILAIAVVTAFALASPAVANTQTTTINSLQSDGWMIVDKTEERQTLPGIAPYQDLKRIVQIVRYRLQKGTAIMACETTYDSQRDHYKENCEKIVQ